MSPKKLLRLPAAVSPLAHFSPGERFQPVLAPAIRGEVRLVLFCCGKIAYELEEELGRRPEEGVAIVRVEQLYPFPADAIAALCRAWPEACYRWVQEEPENMGAWSWIERRLERVLAAAGVRRPQVAYVGRPASPSPAGSFHERHERDQQRVVAAAFAA